MPALFTSDIEAACFRLDGLGCGVDGGGVGYVELDEADVSIDGECCSGRCPAFGVAGSEVNEEAFAGEALGDGFSDAFVGAGDEGYFLRSG
jgi:hypothetical protein